MQNLDSESQVECTTNRIIINTVNTTTFTIGNSVLDCVPWLHVSIHLESLLSQQE